MKRFSTPLVIREMQIKTTMKCYLTPVRMTIIQKTGDKKCGNFPYYCKLVQPLCKTVKGILKKLKLELPFPLLEICPKEMKIVT